MSVQVRLDNTNLPLVLFGMAVAVSNGVLLQNAGRSGDLVCGTVMAKVSASGKWVPLTNLAATDGGATAQGVYIGPDIAEADIVAGDVTDLPIIVGDAGIDVQQLVLENSLTLDSVFAPTTIHSCTVRDQLARRGIFAEETTYISDFSYSA